MDTEESWGDDWSDVEYGDDDDYGEYDESETIPCPECGADVYEDAEQCPSCGQYIVGSTSKSDYVWRGRPLWWIILGALGILAVIFGFAMSF